jgi:very-short-patch-repair endonuclease
MKFRRQHAVGPFVLDFFCREANLVVEVDGAVHYSLDAREHDRLRAEHLERYGYRMLRFRNDEILNQLETVLAAILAAGKLGL